MNGQRIVFVDIETGGLDKDRHPIIQIAAVAVDDAWQEVDSWECKVLFKRRLADPEALRLNSYDADTWAVEGKPPKEACLQLSDFLRRHATVPMVSKKGRPYEVAQLAGHNLVGFDLPFLQAWYGRLGEFLPARYLGLDTLQLALWSFLSNRPVAGVEPENFKLETLADWFHIPLEAHDALADVRACVEVAKRLLERGVVAPGAAP